MRHSETTSDARAKASEVSREGGDMGFAGRFLGTLHLLGNLIENLHLEELESYAPHDGS